MKSLLTGAPNVGEIGKKCVFPPVEKSPAHHALPPTICHAKVVSVHDGALAEEYAVSSTTLVVVEVSLSHVRLISALHVLCDTKHRMLAVR